MAISEHPEGIHKMKWEAIYVALSRVQYRNHIRLLVKRGDWNTVKYISKLKRSEYTKWFFEGYKNSGSERAMVWDSRLALRAKTRDKPGRDRRKIRQLKAKAKCK